MNQNQINIKAKTIMESISKMSVQDALLFLKQSVRDGNTMSGEYNNTYPCFLDCETQDMYVIVETETSTTIKIMPNKQK